MTTPDHKTRAHARLSGSRIERALLCPGSVQLEQSLPDQPSGDAAALGTAIHEYADALLSGKPAPSPGFDDELEKTISDAANEYVTAIRAHTAGWAKRIMPELKVDDGLTSIHPTLGGTADLVAIGGGRMVVYDLKTGRIAVSPRENPQLMTYALGALRLLKAPPNIRITLAIYQNELKEWDIGYADLLAWEATLRDLAGKVWADEPIRTPSSDACQWCRGKAQCPQLAAVATAIATKSAVSDFDATQPITQHALDTATLVTAWAEAVQEAAKAQLMKGQPIPGWTLKKGRKMLRIIDETATMERAMGTSEAWRLQTPSVLKKLGIFPESMFSEEFSAPSLQKVRD
jgi:hypothetical protein